MNYTLYNSENNKKHRKSFPTKFYIFALTETIYGANKKLVEPLHRSWM